MYTLLWSRLVSRSTSPLAYGWFWELHEGLEAKVDTLPRDSIRGRQEETREGCLWFWISSSSPHQSTLLKSLPVPCVRRVASDICSLHHRPDDYSLLAVCILRSFSTWLLIWVTAGPVSLQTSMYQRHCSVHRRTQWPVSPLIALMFILQTVHTLYDPSDLVLVCKECKTPSRNCFKEARCI